MTAPNVDLTRSPHVLPAHTHDGYAATGHTHSGYAAADHTHSGYAAATHTHTPASIGAATASHTHSAADISTRPVTTGSSAGSFAISAGDGTDWYLTATANRTLTVSGGYDGQMIVVDVLASGGARDIALSGVTLTTGMTGSLPVPSGKVGTIGLRRSGGTWRCLAQTVDV